MGICKMSIKEIIALESLGGYNVKKNNSMLVYLFFYYYHFV